MLNSDYQVAKTPICVLLTSIIFLTLGIFQVTYYLEPISYLLKSLLYGYIRAVGKLTFEKFFK